MIPRVVVPCLFVLLAACSSSAAPAAKATDAPKKADTADGARAPAPAADPPTAAPDPSAPTAAAETGQPAPDFTLTDLEGNPHHLADHKGKIVVLEWFNPECPFVNYAHTEGPLVDLAEQQAELGVVWLAINSGAPGKQGHGVPANAAGATKFSMTHPILLDETGAVGRQYGALKTPHLFVIDESGVLRYGGGIDNAPMGEVDGDDPKRGHVVEALADLRAGKDVRVPTASPWGCTVKYGS